MASLGSTRQQLQEANRAAPAPHGKLDSALKKNIGFIKKIRTACSSAAVNESIISDVRTLSLEKYLSEIIPAFFDRMVGLLKADDLLAAVVIFLCLFQRFHTAFSAPMLSLLVSGIFDEARAAKERATCVMVVFELNLVAVASKFSDCDPEYLSETALRVCAKFLDHNVTIVLLRTLMGSLVAENVFVLGAFARRFEPELSQSAPLPELDQQLVTHIQQLLERYCAKKTEDFEKLRRRERRERRTAENTAIKYGKDFENELLEALGRAVAFQKTQLEPMCRILGLPFPQEEPSAPAPQDVGFVWWNSPEEKAFYEEIPLVEDLLEDPGLESDKYAGLAEAEKVPALVDFLALVSQEKHVDRATVALHRHMPSSKATQKRILRFFAENSKTDVLALHAKFLRVNVQYFSLALLELVENLDKGFRTQMHLGKINVRNIVFFAELVKFRLVPAHLIFHKFRNMTMNLFSNNHIEMLILMYERLGKFLLYEPEYRDHTQKMLELLREQSRADNMSQYERLYLNNLFLNIDAFTRPAEAKGSQPRSDSQQFFLQLFRQVLSPDTYPKVAMLMEQVDFCKSATAAAAYVQVFRAPEHLRLDTYLLAAKSMLHLPEKSRFVVRLVVHMLTEKVVCELQENNYKKSVGRTSVVRFLGAMCNAGVLPFRAVSDVLFKIVTHGYRNNFPTAEGLPIDPRDNYFRVQLCCTLLKTVDFSRAKSQGLLFSDPKSVEGFLIFLQYFCYCKQRPFPRDIEFALLDVLLKARDVGVAVDWPEHLSASLERLRDFTLLNGETRKNANESDVATKEIHEKEEHQENEEKEIDNEFEEKDSENELSPSESESDFSSEESTESDVSYSDSEEEKNDSGEEYERREYEKHAQIFARKQFDESVLHIVKEASAQKPQTALKMPNPSSLRAPEAPSSFRFLSRSSEAKNLQLPADSRFVSSFSDKQAQQKTNKEKISNLIINMYQ